MAKGVVPMNVPYFDLNGKIAVITGGATGIGRGIAEGLADAGATIVLCARRMEVLEKACNEIKTRAGVETYPHRLDITNTQEIEVLVDDIIKKFGQIDILVNNAGVGGSEKPILKMTEQDWDATIAIDLRGVFVLSQHVAKTMVERAQGGKVINVASIAALRVTRSMSAYCASKSAVNQLTKVMAAEWTRYNIQVNAILPGLFETPINTHFFATKAGQDALKNMPMKRVGQIDEMRGLAIYLASPASNYMTGASIVIDGGQTMY
jgi:NAD(P)-dependent dehydrogenase (short-subunit alcohol dehydrogenase family)